MDMSEDARDDVFLPGGSLRMELFGESADAALTESLRLARETHWDNLRSPHVFMGLLVAPDAGVRNWGERLNADLADLLDKFQELFHQDKGEREPLLVLHREFLSDNVIRLLRDSAARARDNGRRLVTAMDLLICLLTSTQSIVAECFERIGFTAARLTELAVIAEHSSDGA
jgi:ATP-dependent Clp protease ATP-binding subunit ClpA